MRSLGLDSRSAKQPRPFGHLRAHERLGLGGRDAQAPAAAHLKAQTHFGRARGAVHLGAQALDDGARRARRREQPEPGLHFQVDHAGFDERGKLRHVRRALAARHRERLDLPGLDVGTGGGRIVVEEIHAAREQVLVHRLRALVRHFDDVDAGERGDDGRADVLAGAGTAGADVELAGIRPRERDHLREARERKVLARDQGVGMADHEACASEVGERIVAGLPVKAHVERDVGKSPDDEVVAVGGGARDELRADEGAGAGAVLDHEGLPCLLAQLLREHAPHQIEPAARGGGNDDAHRARGVILGKRGGQRRESGQGAKRPAQPQTSEIRHGFHIRIPRHFSHTPDPGPIIRNVPLPRVFVACALALGEAAAPPAAATSDFLADITERGSAGWGAVSRFEQSPYRGGGVRIDLLPLYLYEGEHVYLHTHRAGLKFDFRSDRRVAGFLSHRFESFPVERIPGSLAGMTTRVPETDFGLSYEQRFEWGNVFGEVLRDASHNSGGTEWRLGAGTERRRGRLKLAPYLMLAARNARLNDYYYGVSPSEATADRPAYH